MPVFRFRETAFFSKHKYRLMRANDWLSFFSAICLLCFLSGDLSYRAIAIRDLASEIKVKAILTGFHTGVFEVDDRVLKVMAQVPRHHFLRQPYSRFAYYNIALPVDSPERLMPEPFLTAMMISQLQLKPTDRVLEIGYASGYEAAIISRLVGKVYAIQQTDQLSPVPKNYRPAENEGYHNVQTRVGEGFKGWPEAGPFDAILVRQSMIAPPPELLAQLAPGGRLVMPVGPQTDQQRLITYTRTDKGITGKRTLYVVVPPLLAGHEI